MLSPHTGVCVAARPRQRIGEDPPRNRVERPSSLPVLGHSVGGQRVFMGRRVRDLNPAQLLSLQCKVADL